MKIAIYGLSRCGKDFLIDQIINRVAGIVNHFYGSKTLRELSQSYFEKQFKELSNDQQKFLREKLVDKVNEAEERYQNIIVDGHYAFPNHQEGFNIVFTNADKHLYDLFFYIKKSPKYVIENSRKSDRQEWREYLEKEENINQWQEFEINGLKSICKELGKELIILDDDTSCSVDFICDILLSKNKIYPNEIADEILKSLLLHINDYKKIVLLDCDKTVSINDLTYDFCDKGNLEKTKLKSIFHGDYYTTYQFYRFHQFISKNEDYSGSLAYSVQNLIFNYPLIDDLNKKNKNVFIIGITTGIADAWIKVNEHHNIYNLIIGKGKSNNENLINNLVTPLVKQEVVKKLRNIGKEVIAIGDSIIDIPMLEASNLGIVVANDKLNNKVIEYIEKNNRTNIYQFAYSNFKYKNLKERLSIW